MRSTYLFVAGTAISLAACAFANGNPKHADASLDWNPRAAASYLDQREAWWSTWSVAARDHDTYCVSCHTVLPYAMARPALRTTLAEAEQPAPERSLIENVTKRVRLWNEVAPFYSDEARGVPKTAESRGTESILNAMVLIANDVPTGKLSADSRLALANMWALQLKTGEARGAWSWIEFHNSPWEGNSQYYGAEIAALAIGMAPENYKSSSEIQPSLKSLREYLLRERQLAGFDRSCDAACGSPTKLPGMLSPTQQKSTVDEALAKQQPDGGFSLSSFVGSWKRRDDSATRNEKRWLRNGTHHLRARSKWATPEISRRSRAPARGSSLIRIKPRAAGWPTL